MSFKPVFFTILIVLGLLLSTSGAQAQSALEPNSPTVSLGTAFTYQGQLKQSGSAVTGSCDFQFSLWDTVTNGMQVASTQTVNAVTVTNGLFTVSLDFGLNAFTGSARWLDVSVRCPAGSGSYTTLTPRQALTPAPYAMYAGNSGALQGNPVGYTAPGTGQVLKWNGSAWSPADDLSGSGGTTYTAGTGLSLTGTQFSISATYQLPQGCAGNQIPSWHNNAWVCAADNTGQDWSMGGNAGTSPAANYLGTTDHVTLTLKVNNTVALRLIPTNYTPNLIGGASDNLVMPNVYGATIGGGGFNGGFEQRVINNYGTIGGGTNNWAGEIAFVGGGSTNRAMASGAVVGGGIYNEATAAGAVVVGGGWDGQAVMGNQANGIASIIGGGQKNVVGADGNYGVIGGGFSNTATNIGAVVVGGYGNTAAGGGAFIGGGMGNVITVSAQSGTIGGGVNNVITTTGSYGTIPGGYQAQASRYGQLAYASGMFNTPGDAQTSMYVLRNTVLGANTNELFLDGSSQRLTFPNNGTVVFDILIVGHNGFGVSAGYQIRGVAENLNGTFSLVGAVSKTILGEDDASWDANVTADTVNKAVKITATGSGLTASYWVASVRTVEVVY